MDKRKEKCRNPNAHDFALEVHKFVIRTAAVKGIGRVWMIVGQFSGVTANCADRLCGMQTAYRVRLPSRKLAKHTGERRGLADIEDHSIQEKFVGRHPSRIGWKKKCARLS